MPVVVPAYTNAMQIVRHTDLLAVIPHSCLGNPFTLDYAKTNELQTFELPLPVPTFHVSAIWHPRLDKDPAHAWRRAQVLAVCQAAYPPVTREQ
jgi:DNA-binding transcriptional LysR family regulator